MPQDGDPSDDLGGKQGVTAQPLHFSEGEEIPLGKDATRDAEGANIDPERRESDGVEFFARRFEGRGDRPRVVRDPPGAAGGVGGLAIDHARHGLAEGADEGVAGLQGSRWGRWW